MSNLKFADDKGLLEMWNKSKEESKEGGLEMNMKKIKYISNTEWNGEGITIEGGNIEKVVEYVYFGKKVSTEEAFERDVRKGESNIDFLWIGIRRYKHHVWDYLRTTCPIWTKFLRLYFKRLQFSHG